MVWTGRRQTQRGRIGVCAAVGRGPMEWARRGAQRGVEVSRGCGGTMRALGGSTQQDIGVAARLNSQQHSSSNNPPTHTLPHPPRERAPHDSRQGHSPVSPDGGRGGHRGPVRINVERLPEGGDVASGAPGIRQQAHTNHLPSNLGYHGHLATRDRGCTYHNHKIPQAGAREGLHTNTHCTNPHPPPPPERNNAGRGKRGHHPSSNDCK